MLTALHHFSLIFQRGEVTAALKITHHDRNIYLLESLCVTTIVQGNKSCGFYFFNFYFCIIHDSSTSGLNIAVSSSMLVSWCRQRCTVLFLSLFHPPFLRVSVHMENSQWAEKGPASPRLLGHYHPSTSTSPVCSSLNFWGYLIFSLFCSMFCTWYFISQKATALHQPLIGFFFFPRILCSFMIEFTHQDSRETCRYP